MNLFKDARYFQILFQSIFLSYGIFYLHWQNEVWLYGVYFGTSILAFALCEYLIYLSKTSLKIQTAFGIRFMAKMFSTFKPLNKKSRQNELVETGLTSKREIPFLQKIKNGLPSVLISSYGLSLLLKTNQWQSAVFAAAVSILSKYIIRVNGKHIFNPSALGIIAAIFICKDCWISPGQWGSSFVILFAVSCFGFIVLTKVQKLDVSITFLGTFLSLLFIRQIIYLGWPADFFIQSISTGSLLLFSFFMITDPKTIPNQPLARKLWLVAVACTAFYLSTFKFVNGAPIFVLVFAQMLVPLLDKMFTGQKFLWEHQKMNVLELKKVYTV